MSDSRDILDRLRRLRCDRPGGRPRPHKAVMLLSVSVLAEAGELDRNRIDFSPRLLDIFRNLFAVARQDTDQLTPHNPFFHLKTDGFWHLHPNPGKEADLKHLRIVKGPGQLRNVIAFASLDGDLHRHLLDPAFRHDFQGVLVQEYLNHAATPVWAVLKDETLIAVRQKELMEYGQPARVKRAPDRIRSAAFRRMVRQIYDMRCAACGVRFFFEDIDLVDAAHLVPFSETGDDRPQNGIALCKNHHWLMDHAILAPGPGPRNNYREPVWHVRKELDDRIEEHRPVLDLKARPVILPRDRNLQPAPEGLDWRMDQLRKGNELQALDYAE